jgi:hypothetical protein
MSSVHVCVRAALCAFGLAASGCGTLGDVRGGLAYPELPRGAASSIVMVGERAYVSMGEAGLGIVSAPRGRLLETLDPPTGAESIDALSYDDGILFALDARPPAAVFAYTLRGAGPPAITSPPHPVELDGISGLSAGGGRVAISGGSDPTTIHSYDRAGRISELASAADVARAQPDVHVAPDGQVAYLSAQFERSRFGIAAIGLARPPAPTTALSAVELKRAGYTAGGSRPSRFPLDADLDGATLVVAHGGGVTLLDVSDPADPRVAGALALPFAAVAVDALDGFAAVVGSVPGPSLAFLDIRDPSTPRLLRTVEIDVPSLLTGVSLGPRHAAVSAGTAGVRFIDR